MKKALKTSTILIVLVLILPLSVWAGFENLFSDPAAVAGSGGGAVNFNARMLNFRDIKDSNHFDFYQIDDSNKFFINNPLVLLLAMPNEISRITLQSLTASPNKPRQENTEASISISAVVIPNETRGGYRDATSSGGAIQTAMTSKDTNEVVGLGVFTAAGEARIYSTSFTEFGMVKKVLDPTTMLLLGSCLLGIGLFAIKFRK
jgi:hypothetical protein